MKIAVIGSRDLCIENLEDFLPTSGIDEIVSGGARGVDRSAAAFARSRNIKLTEFLPDYDRYGKDAPLRRNLEIIDYADVVLAFWDGHSKGTLFVIKKCREKGKQVSIFLMEKEGETLPDLATLLGMDADADDTAVSDDEAAPCGTMDSAETGDPVSAEESAGTLV